MKRADDRQSFELKATLNGLGNALESRVPERALASFRELVGVGEWKVALENLCTNIDDCDVALDSLTARDLASLCRQVGVAPRYWEHLAEQP